MSMSSELPTTVSKPSKARTKLPIYLVAAIVVVLVVVVVVINIVHRLPDPPDDSDVDDDFMSTIGSINVTTEESSYISTIIPKLSTTEFALMTSTIENVSTSESDSSSSSSDEEHKDGENTTLIQVTVTSTVAPTRTTEETTVAMTTLASSSTTENPSSTSETYAGSTEHISETTVIQETTFITPSGVDCSKTCSVSVVESIPRGVWFADRVHTKNAYESWAELLSSARSEIDIFAYKMNLRGKELRYDVDNSTFEGRQLYNILEAQAKSGVLIKLIDCQPPRMPEDDFDADELERLGKGVKEIANMNRAQRRAICDQKLKITNIKGLIQRKGLNMDSLNGGPGGIQHSKAFIVDGAHLFVGSLNFEWKSFSQKLEIGLEFHECPCIAGDAAHLFDQTFASLSGLENVETVDFHPHKIGNSTFQFLASPSVFLNSSHSWDLQALLNLIYEANDFVDISVMQYFPSWIYFKNREFFSQIDNAIRMSVSRGIKFRILVSGDNQEEQKLMFSYLHSLSVLHSPSERRHIEVKFILIPQTSQEAYKNRRMHAKFLLSESKTLIGSSNFGPEYFYKSTGIAVIVDEEPYYGDINRQIKAVFERYWHSPYTQSIQKFGESKGFLPKTSKPLNPFSGWFGFDHIGIFNEKYSAGKLLYEQNREEDQPIDPSIFI